MKNLAIWGTAGKAETFYSIPYLFNGYTISAVTKSDCRYNEPEVFHGIRVVAPTELRNLNIDRLVICSSAVDEIRNYLSTLQLPDSIEILSYDEVMDSYKKQLKKILYHNYQNCSDKEIKHFLDYYNDRDLDVFDDNYGPKSKDYIQYEDRNPYMDFFGKRMYYPKDYAFSPDENGKYIPDLLSEQGINSPHLYLTKNHTINKGDVVVDAGVCEGNFALRYIDEVSKIYLIECDPRWNEPLERTFYPYKDKVVFCDKFLGRETGGTIQYA